MKVKLGNGKPAPEESTLALEALLGCKIAASFREFVRTQDGAKPETNVFKIAPDNESGVNRFIPVREIPRERARLDHLPRQAYPIAWAEGGNYVVIDESRGGAVVFWDHETPKLPTVLADSFDAFLNLLEPFDVSTIQLKSGQVKKVWVDPEFLKKLKK